MLAAVQRDQRDVETVRARRDDNETRPTELVRLQLRKCKGEDRQATGEKGVSCNMDDGGGVALRQLSFSLQLGKSIPTEVSFQDLPKRGRCSFECNV